MHDEDAVKYTVSALQQQKGGNYGYDLYLPDLMRIYVRNEESRAQGTDPRFIEQRRVEELSPQFFAAAWELCRRGIIRPGVRRLNSQSTEDGSAGCGYSVTPFGRGWLAEPHQDDFVPTEPGRFGELLVRYKTRFGSGFHERGQQAVRCYGAHAYLACCAMCGAAVESVLLSVAISKTGDEPRVLESYRAANGRSKIENLILGGTRKQLQTQFRGFMDLLKYWRDESAHGTAFDVTDVEAYTSLALTLRFALFANDNWTELGQR